MTLPKLTILLASPRGFCAGVTRAIDIVEKALEKFGAPVYVRHEIVHNQYVLNDLRQKGAVFVKDLAEVPQNAPVIFSAHGVAKSVPLAAKEGGMTAIDATCPLVTKVHREAELHYKQNRRVVLIGHKNHPEVIGTLGQLPVGAMFLVESVQDVDHLPFSPDDDIAYVTQTTLSIDETKEIITALNKKFPRMTAPKKEDICYATTNRQLAVKDIAERADVVVVMGSKNSSNSNRLVEVAHVYGAAQAFLADSGRDIPWDTLTDMRVMGLTAGASAPEILVQQVIDEARKRFDVTIETMVSAPETLTFKIPKILAA